jgi:pimeloyl-ACP methyl ester carboxylesterase
MKSLPGVLQILCLLVLLPSRASAAWPPALPEGWSEGFVHANGIRIHYYRAVPAPGKPVILAVHGVMDTGLSWASVASRLQGDYDIYMLDTRGHGLSDPFTSSDDRNTMLKDVIGAAQALGLEKPILMGHSMGGATVIRLGAEYPDFAKAIIVVDAGISAPGGRGGGTRGRSAGAPPATAPSAAAAAPRPTPTTAPLAINMRGTPEAMVAQNNFSFDDLVARARRDNPRWSVTDCEYWATAIKRYHGPYTDETWQAMSGSMRTEDGLAKIPVPMIILKADAPPETRQAHQEAARVMQKGKLVHIDNSGHNLQRDQPQRAAEVIKEFLSSSVQGSSR